MLPVRFFRPMRALALGDFGRLPGTRPISPLHARWPMPAGSDFIRTLLADGAQETIKHRISFHGVQVELIRSLKGDPQVADRMADSLMWSTFLYVTGGRKVSPMLMYFLRNQCLQYSPQPGEWRQRVEGRYPFLFRRPAWIAWPLYRLLRKARYLWGVLTS